MQKPQAGKSTFILISLSHAVNDVCWLMIPLLLPLIRQELHFSYTYAGLILTCFSTVILIFSMVSGHLADLYENRKVLAFGFLFTVAAVPLLLFTKTYLQILAVIGVFGIGVSVFHPVGMAFLSRNWKRGISFGLFEATGSVGILAMTFAFIPLVSSLGWRFTALILVLPNAALGLTFLFSRYSLKYVEKEIPPQRSRKDSHNSPSSHPISLKSLILFYVGRGFQIFGMVAIVSFLPLFGVDIQGLPAEKASFLPIFLWVGAIAGGIASGVLSDYLSPLKIILTLVIIVIPAIFAITLPLPFLAIAIFLILIGFAYIGTWPAQNMWLRKVTSERIRGKVYGGIISIVGLAQILSPLLFGFIADKWGLISSFRCTIIPILVAVVCLGVVVQRLK